MGKVFLENGKDKEESRETNKTGKKGKGGPAMQWQALKRLNRCWMSSLPLSNDQPFCFYIIWHWLFLCRLVRSSADWWEVAGWKNLIFPHVTWRWCIQAGILNGASNISLSWNCQLVQNIRPWISECFFWEQSLLSNYNGEIGVLDASATIDAAFPRVRPLQKKPKTQHT